MPRTADDPRYPLRSELLTEAERIITKDRNKTYGEPDEDFQRIASLASAWGFRVDSGDELRELRGSDVAIFMTCLKLARLAWMPTHRDSWMDIAGYSGCGFETATLEAQRHFKADPQEWQDPDMVLPTKLVPIPRLIEDAAQDAAAGRVGDLEALGYFLGNSNPPLEDCGPMCDKGHSFRPLFGGQGCQYRIKKRRNDG